MKLYQLTENYDNLIDLLDNEELSEEMLQAAISSVQDDFKTKAESIAKLIINMTSESEFIKLEEERLAKRRKALENRAKSIKEYLYNQMLATNIRDIKTPVLSLKIQKSGNPSVVILDESLIPPQYYKVDPQLNKSLLSEDLKSGKVIEGVELKYSESLRIK